MTIPELNEIVRSRDIDEFIRVSEARQVKALSRIADDIATRGVVRIILLCGASSAGKTTTAMRLATQLRVNGREVLSLSTDDYFVGDSRNPRDENGEFDYETVEAVDRERLFEDLSTLAEGKPVRLRKFDFSRHEGYDAPTETRLSDEDSSCVVLEGIHALNPLLTARLKGIKAYRLFIDPTPDLEIIPGLRLESAQLRFFRRMVRDRSFRKLEPLDTFRLWPKVCAGESKWIRPFAPLADATFNSYLPYEMAVLKNYVYGHLERIRHDAPETPQIEACCELFSEIADAPSRCVPGDSILRETIGGSQLDY